MKTAGKNILKIFLLFLLIVSLGSILPASGLSENHQINGTVSLLSPVLRGEPFNFHGNIPANPSHEIQLWVFGKKYVTFNQIAVTDDDSFNWSLETHNLTSGQYYILVQDSGNDGRYDIIWDNKSDNIINNKRYDEHQIIYTLAEAQNMYDTDAVTVLRREFNSTGIDDAISVYSLDIVEPYITINPVSDHAAGDVINITGTTNFPVNTTLWISAGPKKFTKYPPHYFYGQVQVIQGTNSNIWSVKLNTSTFSLDEYTVEVQPVNKDPLFGHARFNITARHASTLQTISVPSTTIPRDSPSPQPHEVTFLNGTSRPTTSAPLPVVVPISALAICCFFGRLYSKTQST